MYGFGRLLLHFFARPPIFLPVHNRFTRPNDRSLHKALLLCQTLVGSFTLNCSSSISCMNGYLVIDTGGWLCVYLHINCSTAKYSLEAETVFD